MKKSTLIKLGMLTTMLGAAAAQAQVVNFHSAFNYQANTNGLAYHALYVGQGAYSDPGNNVWNGFGKYPGPGVEYFYGPSNPYSGNPGNPYAAWGPSLTTTSGPLWGTGNTIDSSGNPTGNTGGNATSAGTLSPITLSIAYSGGDNGLASFGGGVTEPQGSPQFILGEASLVGPGNTGTFTLQNVPAGTYSLYLYGANYNDDRGTSFTVSSGTAHNGISGTLNSGTSPASVFAEGINYVIFNGVQPDGSGNISGTWFGNPADGVGNSNLSGEGDFNGMQLVKNTVVVQPTLSIHASGSSVTVSWTPAVGTLQAADAVTGTYTNLTGVTAPYVTSAAGAQKFYRVKP